MILAKAQRGQTTIERQRNKSTTVAPGASLIANPTRTNRGCGPAHDHSFGRFQSQFNRVGKLLATGQVPAGIETTMANDGYAVGQSCGLAGWTP